jgi:hypothetical protein
MQTGVESAMRGHGSSRHRRLWEWVGLQVSSSPERELRMLSQTSNWTISGRKSPVSKRREGEAWQSEQMSQLSEASRDGGRGIRSV